ncbi:tRNA uridine-5-carboxymethylaminomethyl(34) synthesis GTPase MnmE [Mesoplasma florum]|uniref:tRNA uridine-5-carboxymethylaminomethyl(34) synthesis GTPase MnmE n=1 Tax=Mesoplasma florum TaxID=2151 RepID=UPI000BE2BEAA|nr:tRNA uridine-5-carboxymethylaminomethyl(34) synthesis GTPase MnmE [Mesoplasma florum]ATI72971.1 tRNA uridine-5-carboxymethylaminomethyl(34) synthesis GTPase MnmE [Mesoplasma florum]AVN61374.1 tRNA uridine-5-carboxymethylaminomethyl(34) synthesis GTPase MnmE [Mesoplasma florum]
MNNLNQTIVAPTTNISTQAISLIRISGDDSFNIINKLLKTKIKEEKNVWVRKMFDGQELVDEVVITSFVSPASFTGENVVEIACHGGILNTQRIINLIIKNGARMANKGEFSQRAFLNNKIDLIQAEGINDLIFAKNELALKIGVNNMSGTHNQSIINLKSNLLDIISRIQVSIDYPDYDDVEGSSIEDLTKSLSAINNEVKSLLKRSKIAIKNTNGIKTAIVGKTNVGKSSLLNALLNEDKAIVTDIHGTTRDIVTGEINLENISLNLIDTAGIRKTNDIVEGLGIEKSLKMIDEAELVLFVVDFKSINDKENKMIFDKLKGKTYILVFNKSEFITNEEKNKISKEKINFVYTSAINNEIDDLIKKIEEMHINEELTKNDSLILINLEQISLVEQVKDRLEKSLSAIIGGMPIDIVNVDLHEAWDYLNQLIGEQYDEEIIDNIFKKYCLGK